MRFLRISLPAAALGGAFLLAFPQRAVSFVTSGSMVGLDQRDVRVFNNFTAPTANDNVTPDPDWPGFVGAELAIWKAAVEWGSELHNGNGNGDPTQPGGLGSGGANLDFTWQGRALGIGGTNDNIHSEISGCAGGVYTFIETPTGNGWRSRFCSGWAWQDGPGNEGAEDIQAAATVAHGFVLGLDPSPVAGATMNAPISGGPPLASQRSIEADDIAGVQFIYGAAAASKPHISSAVEGGGMLSITGTNFSPTNNEVWFTRVAPNPDGEPVKVSGVTSNGTQILVAIPPNAGDGDVLVRNDGTGFANLSNAFARGMGSCPTPTIYCTAKTASSGLSPAIGFTGTPSLVINNFALTCFNGAIPNVNGIHFWSNSGPNSAPFFFGTLCLLPPVTRGPVHTYDSLGSISVPITVQASEVGLTRWFQFWFRDLNQPDGTGVGLSDGLEVQFCN